MKTINTLLNENSTVEKSIRQQLLLAILQKNTSFLISHSDYLLTQSQYDAYQTGLNKLKNGMPLAYVIGRQGFWRHEFLVNQHTLIPRPDTEVLVETILNLAEKMDKNSLSENINLLDLGTGSGCIAISLAFEKPNWQITAVDLSQNALQIAQQNAVQIGVNHVKFLQGDWYQALTLTAEQTSPQKFDIIVSNPPYIDRADAHLADLTDEPLTALVADNQGLADIEKIVQGSGVFLQPSGLLAIEHGYDQAQAVQSIFAQYGFTDITTVQDYGKNDRVTYGFLTS